MIAWQELSPEQAASVRETKLGGALGWIVASSAVLAVGGPVIIAWGYLANQALLFQYQLWLLPLWAAIFVVMTLARAAATPVVSVGLLIATTLLRIAMTLGSYAFGSFESYVLTSLIALQVIFALAECAMIAAFAGYMLQGIRPNLYYRRRVPVVAPG